MTHTSMLLATGILGAAFLGSWHCTVMCTPMASLMAHRKSLWSYHLGRGVSYTLLGVLGGWLGHFFLTQEFYVLRLISAFLFAAMLCFFGIRMWQGQRATFLPGHWIWKKLIFDRKSGWAFGWLSVFLPCGWLYTYVFAAAATKSPEAGGLVMFLFWLAGIPALSALPIFVKKTLQIADERRRKIGGGILIGTSLYSLLAFYFFS